MIRRPSPLAQLTIALVLVTVSLVLLSDLLLGAVPRHAEARQRERARIAQALAVQVAELLRFEQPDAVEATLQGLARRVEGVVSLGVRRFDTSASKNDSASKHPNGELVAQAGGHDQRWQLGVDLRHQFSVPLASSGHSWGAVEIAFEPDTRNWFLRQWQEPMIRLLTFLLVAGAAAYSLYLRRALQHLDPASVIPDRVQHAFDAMAEGVVVLDANGRVLLANREFRSLHPHAKSIRTGQPLSVIPWLGAELPTDLTLHPWHQAMAQSASTSGYSLEIGRDVDQLRKLVVNCAPITDPGGAVRGCLVTFDDLTDLHRANAALRQAMAEAEAAKHEVQRKNTELLYLATRDPLTGCLNRRALFDALGPLFDAVRRDGCSVGCLVLDIDHFKLVNDTHGHSVGDRVIQEVAKVLLLLARPNDLICRYGGEEFVVVLPNLSADEVRCFAEHVRARIQADCGAMVSEVPGLKVTVSVGCHASGQHASNPHVMIERADQALYSAKRAGRNRVALVTG